MYERDSRGWRHQYTQTRDDTRRYYKVQGKRIYPDEEGKMRFDEGDYGQDSDGIWWVRAPGTRIAGPLLDHDIQEHEDGTISVSPSIWVQPDPGFHGYLKGGAWAE